MKGFRKVHFEPKENGIHIANLPPNVTVEFLKSLFSESGTIINVILKQKPTSCYAFIDFTLQEEAEAAVRDFNYTKLNGESIIVTRTTSQIINAIASGQGNLFIKGLDPSIDCLQLHELFSNYGEIVSCRIPTINGQPRGFGYVQFLKEEDAERAMKELVDSTVNGKPITIGPFLKRSERPLSEAFQNSLDSTFTNVFVKNLPDNINSLLSLLKLFQEFGQITSARIVPERRIGYVMMADHDSAVRAVVNLCGRTIFGRRLSVCRSLSAAERANFVRKPIESILKPTTEESKKDDEQSESAEDGERQHDETLAKAVGSTSIKREAPKETAPPPAPKPAPAPMPSLSPLPQQPVGPAQQIPAYDPVLHQQQVNFFYQQQMQQQQVLQSMMYGNPPPQPPMQIIPQNVVPPPQQQPQPQAAVKMTVEPPSTKPAPKPVPKQPSPQKQEQKQVKPSEIVVSQPKDMQPLIPAKDVLAKPPPPSVPANQKDIVSEPEPASASMSDSGNEAVVQKPPVVSSKTKQEFISSSEDDRPSPMNPFGMTKI